MKKSTSRSQRVERTDLYQQVTDRIVAVFNVEQCDSLPEAVVGVTAVPLAQEDVDTVSTPVFNRILDMLNAYGVKATSWCPDSESNQGHGDFQSPALPTELSGQRGALNRNRRASSTKFICFAAD